MTENKPPEDNISEEFRNLGQNLAEVLRTAWESPERKKFQQELETGLTELGKTLKREANTFNDSPTGQRLKENVQDVREGLHTGEAQTKVRSELLSALRFFNGELEKVIEHVENRASAGTNASVEQSASEQREAHPDNGEANSGPNLS
ncbi:MAG TPA: hypothetical protein VF498_06545 [Anaerolineales bacterium]